MRAPGKRRSLFTLVTVLKAVDCLITNFHLPESTLIMLVSALIGREQTLSLYNLAVEQHYPLFQLRRRDDDIVIERQ